MNLTKSWENGSLSSARPIRAPVMTPRDSLSRSFNKLNQRDPRRPESELQFDLDNAYGERRCFSLHWLACSASGPHSQRRQDWVHITMGMDFKWQLTAELRCIALYRVRFISAGSYNLFYNNIDMYCSKTKNLRSERNPWQYKVAFEFGVPGLFVGCVVAGITCNHT